MSQHYNHNQVPISYPIYHVEIKVNWNDRSGEAGKNFSDVLEFASFLKSNPDIAGRLRYTPKDNEPIDLESLMVICEETFKNPSISYVTTVNTKKLNRLFNEPKTVYSRNYVGENTVTIESNKIAIHYTHNELPELRKLRFELKTVPQLKQL